MYVVPLDHHAIRLVGDDRDQRRAGTPAEGSGTRAPRELSDLVRHCERVLRATIARASAPGRPAVVRVAADGGRIEVDGAGTVWLDKHPPMRRLVAALTHLALESPGATMSLDQLFAVAWPGERADPASAVNRAYVTMSRLRKLTKIGDVLEPAPDGFRLDPTRLLPLEEP